MKEIRLSDTKEIIYEEILDNGLKLFLYKKPDFEKKYAFFETNYGSINNEFIPIDNKSMKQFPLGIAHFLEHKLFESNTNENVFTKFENNGAYVNAATSYNKTYYYFECTDKFEDSLETLLDFVQDPYFTDDNVEKEKGIIAQEIDMVNDNPDRFLFQKLTLNALVNSFYKYDIAGTKESISNITKKDLYECYNTFYNPSNMFVVIAGDINVEETINIIRNNQDKKNFKKLNKIIQKVVKEPDEVNIKDETFKHNVANEKVGYCYKMNFNKMNKEEKFLFKKYVDIYLKILFGETSYFSNNLIKDGIVKSYFEYDYEFLDNDNYTLLIYFVADPINIIKLEKELKDKLKDKKDYKEMFELWKKNLLANSIRGFESLDFVVNMIRSSYENYGQILNNSIDLLKTMDYEHLKLIINKLNFDNVSKILIKPAN